MRLLFQRVPQILCSKAMMAISSQQNQGALGKPHYFDKLMTDIDHATGAPKYQYTRNSRANISAAGPRLMQACCRTAFPFGIA